VGPWNHILGEDLDPPWEGAIWGGFLASCKGVIVFFQHKTKLLTLLTSLCFGGRRKGRDGNRGKRERGRKGVGEGGEGKGREGREGMCG